ncbi:MAG: hypothetical protein JW718_07740 [Desulfovibrionaceae bacterium]|nr:hypothetical protein [Desulfovibrionaceae bacterium]
MAIAHQLKDILADLNILPRRLSLRTPGVQATVPMLRGVFGAALHDLEPDAYAEVFIGLGGHAHIAAVRNVRELMRVAVPEEPVADKKDQEGVDSVQRFYAPMRYGDAVYTVSMLVKNYRGSVFLRPRKSVSSTISRWKKRCPLILAKMSGRRGRGLGSTGTAKLP